MKPATQDTPRTDAATLASYGCTLMAACRDMTELARDLERENAALLAALVAQEEAEEAQASYRREQGAQLCGLAAEDHDAWKLRLSHLAQVSHELTAKARALRAAALSASNHPAR